MINKIIIDRASLKESLIVDEKEVKSLWLYDYFMLDSEICQYIEKCPNVNFLKFHHYISNENHEIPNNAPAYIPKNVTDLSFSGCLPSFIIKIMQWYLNAKITSISIAIDWWFSADMFIDELKKGLIKFLHLKNFCLEFPFIDSRVMDVIVWFLSQGIESLKLDVKILRISDYDAIKDYSGNMEEFSVKSLTLKQMIFDIKNPLVNFLSHRIPLLTELHCHSFESSSLEKFPALFPNLCDISILCRKSVEFYNDFFDKVKSLICLNRITLSCHSLEITEIKRNFENYLGTRVGLFLKVKS